MLALLLAGLWLLGGIPMEMFLWIPSCGMLVSSLLLRDCACFLSLLVFVCIVIALALVFSCISFGLASKYIIQSDKMAADK